MKKIILSGFFCCLLFSTFAQAQFTEQTVNEIRQAFVSNPLKAVAERTSPDFTMTGAKDVADYAAFKAMNEGGGLADWPTTDVKIKQFSNVAIVTGISNHVVKLPNNKTVKVHQRFTETYEFQNGKWVYASAHYTDIIGK